MKRFFLGIVVGMLVVSALWNERARPPRPVQVPDFVHTASAAEPVLIAQRDPNQGFPPVRDGREAVSDIPVPIVPGTRVTEAHARPPEPAVAPRRAPRPVAAGRPRQVAPTAAAPTGYVRVITGRLSATDERALDDVQQQVDQAIHQWLGPEVSSSWAPPAPMRNSLVRKTDIKAVQKDIDGERVTMYEAAQTIDFSPAQRTTLIQAYHRELVTRRLAILAGIIAFVLVCLAALAGYIRTDEATKGYYTNRLRLVSAAGVGAAGVVIYHLLT